MDNLIEKNEIFKIYNNIKFYLSTSNLSITAYGIFRVKFIDKNLN